MERALVSGGGELAKLKEREWTLRLRLIYSVVARPVRRFTVVTFGWKWAGVLLGTTVVAGGLCVLAFSWLSGLLGLFFAGIAFFCVFYVPSDDTLVEDAEMIPKALASLIHTRNILEADVLRINANLPQIREKRRLAELEESGYFRRQALLKRDWKSLRSVPFETFLEEVFKELGYAVETTKVTGDQGGDLIVTKYGHRHVIQVKGYFNSVSNDAVQQAFAAKEYYRCEGCAVVTNSRFTASAKELAGSVGCVLIDEETLPLLITGEFDPWQNHLETTNTSVTIAVTPKQ
jgi:hypothetical protein